MKQLYFHFVDFIDPPSFRERQSISFTNEASEDTSCGWTKVDFGDDERYLIIFITSDNAEAASIELSKFLLSHGLKILPTTLDWIKAHVLVHHLNKSILAYHHTAAAQGFAEKVDLTKMKDQINRKIVQNEKWDQQFRKLMYKIKEHEQRPDIKLKLEILDECVKLYILPEE